MLSIPPATTISESPSRIACAASMMDFKPEPQTLLTVVAPTEGGSPANIAACRAGACPTPAVRTQPMMTFEGSGRRSHHGLRSYRPPHPRGEKATHDAFVDLILRKSRPFDRLFDDDGPEARGAQ